MFCHAKATKTVAEKQLLKDKRKATRTLLDKGNKCLEALANELVGVNLCHL